MSGERHEPTSMSTPSEVVRVILFMMEEVSWCVRVSRVRVLVVEEGLRCRRRGGGWTLWCLGSELAGAAGQVAKSWDTRGYLCDRTETRQETQW